MQSKDFEDIDTLIKSIDQALHDSKFTELASLSAKLQSLVEKLTENKANKKAFEEKDLEKIEALLALVLKYQVETELKFKDYTLKISQQTKMHNAYKQG